jgi:hypothetical protein
MGWLCDKIPRFFTSLAPWTGAPGSPKRTWAEKDGRSPQRFLAYRPANSGQD